MGRGDTGDLQMTLDVEALKPNPSCPDVYHPLIVEAFASWLDANYQPLAYEVQKHVAPTAPPILQSHSSTNKHDRGSGDTN